MGARRETVLFLAVLAAAVGLRVAFFTGLILYDDAHYAQRAMELSQGVFTPPSGYFEARIGLVGPTALAYRWLGVTPVATAAFTFLCSLASVTCAHLLGRAAWGARAGLLAATVVALFPLDILGASQLFANAPLTLLAGTGVGLFLLAERRAASGLALASGVCLGLAAVVHETALLVLVFYPAYALVVARPARRHVLVVAGLVVGLAVDPLLHGALMGEPGARLATLAASGTAHGTAGDVDYRGLNWMWLGEPILRVFTEQELALHPWLVVPVCAVRLIRPRGPDDRALALFVLVVAAWIFYGTLSPATYAPLARVPRYLAPLALPAAWLLGGELARWRPRRAAAALAALAVAAMVCCAVDGGRARLLPFAAVHRLLASARAARVVAEPRLVFPLRYVAGNRAGYDVEPLDAAREPTGALVVAATPAVRERVAALPGATLVAHIAPPETLYLRLLRSGPVHALLRGTRPDFRVVELEQKVAPTAGLDVYRVP